MNSILILFLSLSLSGSLLALLLFALRPLTKKWLSHSWQYYIWLVVILRLLLPLTPEVSIMGEMAKFLQNFSQIDAIQQPSAPQQNSQDGTGAAPGAATPPASQETDGALAVEPAQEQASVTAAFDTKELINYAWVFWLGVTILLIGYKTATYRSFTRFARAGAKEYTKGRILNLYMDELSLMGIKKPIPLCSNNLVASPMLVGFLKPVVILPKLDVTDDELRQIIRHELTHYKKLDYLYKWLMQLTLCIHWFNPLVYMVSRQVNKSCELACDEAVIRRMDENGRIQYGDALMVSLKAQGNYSNNVISMTMSENANIVKERLEAIMSYKKRTAAVVLAGAVLAVMLLGGGIAAGAVTTSTLEAPGTGNPIAGVEPVDSSVTEGYAAWELGSVLRWAIKVESENVIVKTGGTSVRIEVSEESKDNYVLEDYMHVITPRIQEREVALSRKEGLGAGAVYSPTIIITVPESFQNVLNGVHTTSGNITIENSHSSKISTSSESGTITVKNSYASEYIIASSPNGAVVISDSHAVERIHANAENGTVSLTNATSDGPIHTLDKNSPNGIKTTSGNPAGSASFASLATAPQPVVATQVATSGQQQQYTDSSRSITSIDVDAAIVSLKLEQSTDDTFTASLSYPASLNTWYADANVSLTTSNQSLAIKVSYPGGEINQTPNQPSLATLTVSIPQRQYNRVKLAIFSANGRLEIPIQANELELVTGPDEIELSLPNSYDRLTINNNAGDLTLYTSHIYPSTQITSNVGDIHYHLPGEPNNIEIVVKDMFLGDATFPRSWQYSSTSHDTVTYRSGNGQNKINAEIEVATIFFYN